MDLRSEAADLYGLSPARFVEARDARSAKARQAGDKELAAAIKKLKRPAPAAWLANVLTRQRAEKVEALVALGARLRDAQQRLAADELRALTRQGRQAVAELVKESAHLAGDQAPSGAVLRQLEETLNAALADAEAGAAVLAGQLTAPVSYAGLGATIAGSGSGPGAAMTGADGGPGAGVTGADGGPGAGMTGAQSTRPPYDKAKEAAERALASAEKRLAQLNAELADAVREHERIRGKLEALAGEAEQLRQKGTAAQARVDELREAVAGCSARVEMARGQAPR